MTSWLPTLQTTNPEEGYALIASSQVVATHFANVAAANGYWSETL